MVSGPQLCWEQKEPKSGAGYKQWGHFLHPALVLKIGLREYYASGWIKYLLLLLFIMGSVQGRSGITPHPGFTGPFPNKTKGREASHSRGHN